MDRRQHTGNPHAQNVWPAVDVAIATIMFGDRFANDRLHFLSRIMMMAFIALLISVAGNIVMFPNPPHYKYVITSSDGTVLPQVPLNQSNHDEKFVVDWTVDAVTRLFSFDFMNYRVQLQDAQRNLTAAGWESFQDLLRESNNFNAVLGNSFVMTAVPIGSGKVTKTGMINGVWAWKVEFPMKVSYRAAPKQRDGVAGEPRYITDTLNMSVTVTRVGVFLNHTGLGIKAIVGKRNAN